MYILLEALRQVADDLVAFHVFPDVGHWLKGVTWLRQGLVSATDREKLTKGQSGFEARVELSEHLISCRSFGVQDARPLILAVNLG